MPTDVLILLVTGWALAALLLVLVIALFRSYERERKAMLDMLLVKHGGYAVNLDAQPRVPGPLTRLSDPDPDLIPDPEQLGDDD